LLRIREINGTTKGNVTARTTGTGYIRSTVVKAFSDSTTTNNTNTKTDEPIIGRVKLLMVNKEEKKKTNFLKAALFTFIS
jgi:hydroxymethylglutaryl-CoA reductase (NADPH)